MRNLYSHYKTQENPILSVCIPTYNRPIELKRALRSIISQANSKVEIVICDNSTTKDTEALIKEYFQHDFIRYYKNDKNVGFDRNIFLTISRSIGRYIWFFGDDDELLPGAISYVLNLISEYPEISYIWVNSYKEDANKLASKYNSDMWFKNRNSVIENLSGLLVYISATIIKRDSLLGYEVFKEYFGNAIIQLDLVFKVLTQNGRFYYIGTPFIRQNSTGIDNFDILEVFGINFWKTLMRWQDYFDKKAIRKTLKKNFNHLWKGIYTTKLRNPNFLRGRWMNLIKMNKHSIKFWLIILPCLSIPRHLSMTLYKIFKSVKN